MMESIKPGKVEEESKGEGMDWHQETIHSNNGGRNEKSGIKVVSICVGVCVGEEGIPDRNCSKIPAHERQLE